MVGRAYTTLTDNKTFAFTAACFADNQMTWNVFATTPTLDEQTKEKIYEHAKSLGYNPEFFTEIRYDSCKSKSAQVWHSLSFNDKRVDLPVKSNGSSSENQVIVPSSIPTESELETGPNLFCGTCKKMCPNLISKGAYRYKYYYQKLRKYEVPAN